MVCFLGERELGYLSFKFELAVFFERIEYGVERRKCYNEGEILRLGDWFKSGL